MLKRHNLLIIKNNNIPGIVKRQDEKREGYIQLGYSYAQKKNGVRARSVKLEKISCVEKIITPSEVLEIYVENIKPIKILDEIIKISKKNDVKIGLFGSLALEIVTGQKYFVEGSDIDLIVYDKSKDKLKKFYSEIINLEKDYLINIDIELEIDDCYSCKLKEFLSEQKTVLVKGISDVKLINKATIWKKV